MNLIELKKRVDHAIEAVKEDGNNPIEIPVSLQIDWQDGTSVFSRDKIELHYDNDCFASGCVLTADGGE